MTDETDRSSRSNLLQIVGALHEPAYLVTPEGNVIFANGAAAEVFESPPDWLQSAVRSPGSRHFARVCTLSKVEFDDQSLFLVLPQLDRDRSGVHFQPPAKLLAALPPALSRVARLITMGMSDKEIAECTELTLASVRTYTRRIYKRLGVSGRQELMALALAAKKHRSQ